MRALIILVIYGIILSTATPALAEDCERINTEKVCWDGGTAVTLSWGYAKSTVGKYQIEVRDFNWLGSAFVRVTHNSTVKEGMLSEGEAFVFDFTNGSGFEGIKIVADQISNINPMPANIGTYPNNPNAKITVRLQVDADKKTPTPGVSISTEGEAIIGSTIIANVKTENTGDADLASTDVSIYYDGLKLMKDFDANNGVLDEDTAAGSEIQWENISNYRLTPAYHTIVRDGFFIDILNFSNKTALISAGYNLSTKSDTLIEGNSIIFNFTGYKYYRGVKLAGNKLTGDSAELTLQFPAKNMLKRNYNSISYGRSETTKLRFLLPAHSKTSFTISVKASGYDWNGKIYNASSTTTISASNTLSIKKRTTNSLLGGTLYPEAYPGVGGVRGVNNITYVALRVDNLQDYPVNSAKLVDSIPPSFNFLDDANRSTISWDFNISAGEYREFKYEIRAKRQGVYNLPKAELTWNEWGDEVHKESESPRTTVSGPYIGIDRSFSKSNLNSGETLRVTLSIINNGDVPANVTVKEIVPENATFLSGQLSFSGFLNPGEQANFAYNISLYREGTLEFGEPEISSKYRGFDWFAPVPSKKVQFLSQISASAPYPSVTAARAGNVEAKEKGLIQGINEKMPWLEGAVSITTFLFAIFLLLTLSKINRML